MKIIFILSLILMMGCSKDLNLDPELLSFKYSKEGYFKSHNPRGKNKISFTKYRSD